MAWSAKDITIAVAGGPIWAWILKIQGAEMYQEICVEHQGKFGDHFCDAPNTFLNNLRRGVAEYKWQQEAGSPQGITSKEF